MQRWIIPIKNSSIIPDERTRDAFIRAAFANITEVHGPHAELAEALHKRQQKQPIVAHIGDILLQFVDRFEPLIKYSANQWDSRYAMERERSVNPSFENFVKVRNADLKASLTYVSYMTVCELYRQRKHILPLCVCQLMDIYHDQ